MGPIEDAEFLAPLTEFRAARTRQLRARTAEDGAATWYPKGEPRIGEYAVTEEPGSIIDTSVPHSARIWNYWLGGKDNYPVDRAAGDQYLQVYPGIVDIARAGRN